MQPESRAGDIGLMENHVRKTVLPYGLTIVTERIPHVRSVSLGVWIMAGAETDRIENMGMAHFIEHMAFKGTETRSAFEIADSIESLGGSLNAFTSRDLTCYYVSILDEHVNCAVEILADILCHSLFSFEEIEREKCVVIEEIHSSQDIPEDLVQDTFGDATLSPDPASKPVLGTIETVQCFVREDVIKYISSHYSERNILVAAAGNIEHDKLIELVSSYFTFNNSSYFIEKQYTEAIINRKIMIHKDILQSHICYGGLTFGFRDNRRTTLWLINTLLGSGMSSRLFQNIRERHGLAYTIYSYTELMMLTGFIATYAATETQNQERTLSLIHDEYEKLTRSELDSETIERVKSQLKGNLVLSLESTTSRMNRLAKQELFLGTYYDINDTIHQIEQVTPGQIIEVAREIFSEKNLRTVIVSQ